MSNECIDNIHRVYSYMESIFSPAAGKTDKLHPSISCRFEHCVRGNVGMFQSCQSNGVEVLIVVARQLLYSTYSSRTVGSPAGEKPYAIPSVAGWQSCFVKSITPDVQVHYYCPDFGCQLQLQLQLQEEGGSAILHHALCSTVYADAVASGMCEQRS